MRKILLAAIWITLIFIGFSKYSQNVEAANVSFNVIVSSGTTFPGQGSISPASITVDKGDNVTITFSVPKDDIYCCGIQVKGNSGEFDTGNIAPGSTKQVKFTASASFGFTSYWTNSNAVKATGSVNVSGVTPPASPPGNLTAIAVSTSQINLSWNVTSSATRYEVYRGDILVETVGSTTWTNNGLNPGASYDYKIKACNSAGCSDFSTTVLVITQQTGGASSSTSTAQSSSSTPSIVVYTDTMSDYVLVKDKIYGFNEIPIIRIGDKYMIYGRTEALAVVKININSGSKEYTTTADINGYWTIDIDTNALNTGTFSFQKTISSNGKTQNFSTVPFKIQLAELANTGETSSSSTSSKSSGSGSNKILSYALIFIVPIILIAITVVYFLKVNKNKPAEDKKSEKKEFPPIEVMKTPAKSEDTKKEDIKPSEVKEKPVKENFETDDIVKQTAPIVNQTDEKSKDIDLESKEIEQAKDTNLIDELAKQTIAENAEVITPSVNQLKSEPIDTVEKLQEIVEGTYATKPSDTMTPANFPKIEDKIEVSTLPQNIIEPTVDDALLSDSIPDAADVSIDQNNANIKPVVNDTISLPVSNPVPESGNVEIPANNVNINSNTANSANLSSQPENINQAGTVMDHTNTSSIRGSIESKIENNIEESTLKPDDNPPAITAENTREALQNPSLEGIASSDVNSSEVSKSPQTQVFNNSQSADEIKLPDEGDTTVATNLPDNNSPEVIEKDQDNLTTTTDSISKSDEDNSKPDNEGTVLEVESKEEEQEQNQKKADMPEKSELDTKSDSEAELSDKPEEVKQKEEKPELPELIARPDAPKVQDILKQTENKHPFMMPKVNLENKIPTPINPTPVDEPMKPLPSSI